MARPSKYNSKLHPRDYIKLSKEGLTREEICVQWDISRDTLNRWSKDSSKPEFSDAYKKGNTFREAYYIKTLRDIALGVVPAGNMTAFIWFCKNCLKWGDSKVEPEPIEIKLAYDPNVKPASLRQ